MLSALPILLLGTCLWQEPAPESAGGAQPEPVRVEVPEAAADDLQEADAAPAEPLAGLLGDREITVAEYQEFLWQRFGRRALREYADLLLLREASERYETPLDPAVLDAAVEERFAGMRGELDEEAFREQIRRAMLDANQLRASLRLEVEKDLRATALVRATRVATDAKLRALFEQQYGTGGSRTEVAHVLVMPNQLRAARIRAGTRPEDIDLAAMDREARRLAEEALAKLQEGADFGEIVAEYSQDQSTKDKGGVLLAWRPGLYGEGFSELVDSLQPGEVGAQVVASGAGYHVVKVLTRTVTDFAEVREELQVQYMQSEPGFQEKDELIAGLRAESPLEMP